MQAMVQEQPVRVERRLSAILAADVAGYSRLTGMDEEGTHAQLQDLGAKAIRAVPLTRHVGIEQNQRV